MKTPDSEQSLDRKRFLKIFLVMFGGLIFRIGSFYYKVMPFNWASFHSISELIIISAKGGFKDWLSRMLSSLTGLHENCSF